MSEPIDMSEDQDPRGDEVPYRPEVRIALGLARDGAAQARESAEFWRRWNCAIHARSCEAEAARWERILARLERVL